MGGCGSRGVTCDLRRRLIFVALQENTAVAARCGGAEVREERGARSEDGRSGGGRSPQDRTCKELAPTSRAYIGSVCVCCDVLVSSFYLREFISTRSYSSLVGDVSIVHGRFRRSRSGNIITKRCDKCPRSDQANLSSSRSLVSWKRALAVLSSSGIRS
jgi:hypothetical protein